MSTRQQGKWSTTDTQHFCWNFDDSPQNSPGPGSKPVEHFFMPEVWDLLLSEKNHYADQVHQQIQSPIRTHLALRDSWWNEMKIFIALYWPTHGYEGPETANVLAAVTQNVGTTVLIVTCSDCDGDGSLNCYVG